MSLLARPLGDDDGGALIDAWRATQFGVLWGVATVAMECMATPFEVLIAQPIAFFATLTTCWCVKCILIAWLAFRLERRHRGAGLVARMLLSAVFVSAISMAWMNRFLPESSVYVLRRGIDPVAIFCYDTWGMLFYGSLLVVACVVTRRSSRTRRLLRQAEIDREVADAMLAEIRLKALQGSVNPAVLQDALAEVRRRYVAGSTTSDRLMDDLVGFLREAVPSLRGSVSTLGAELALTRAYLRLREELYPGHGTWRIDAADDLGTLAFPPLQLVDAIDRWIAASGGAAAGVIAITRRGDAPRVDVRPAPAPPPVATGADVSSPRRLVLADETARLSTAREITP